MQIDASDVRIGTDAHRSTVVKAGLAAVAVAPQPRDWPTSRHPVRRAWDQPADRISFCSFLESARIDSVSGILAAINHIVHPDQFRLQECCRSNCWWPTLSTWSRRGVRSKYIRTPSAYRSARPSTSRPATCSGAMQLGVPTIVSSVVTVPASGCRSLAMPKSVSVRECHLVRILATIAL